MPKKPYQKRRSNGPRWQQNPKGNWIYHRGARGCTVFQTPDGWWKYVIECVFSEDEYDSALFAMEEAEERIARMVEQEAQHAA